MSGQTFSRLPKPKEGYFLRRQLLEVGPSKGCDPLLFCTEDKDKIFELLKKYEEAEVSCYVENLQGERIS